jgi:hypothetical protein
MCDFVAISHSAEHVAEIIHWSEALISFKTTRPWYPIGYQPNTSHALRESSDG